MKTINRIALTVALATSLTAGAPQVFAHGWNGKPGGAHHEWKHGSRMNNLKAQLQITSKQESAWNTFVQAMKKTGPQNSKQEQGANKHQPGPLKPAPQILEKMADRMANRAQQAKARASAMQTLYKFLTPTQRAIINTHMADMMHHFHHRFHRG